MFGEGIGGAIEKLEAERKGIIKYPSRALQDKTIVQSQNIHRYVSYRKRKRT